MSNINKRNAIAQKSVGELLDGRLFYIPSYQRGYRWTKTQVYDLCNDLLEYALKKEKNKDSFYSLQPLIVRNTKKEILGEEKDVYEVIDGQQRLTSISILIRALMKTAGYNNCNALSEEKDVNLYRLYYETRSNSYNILNKIGNEDIKKAEVKDIDIAHIVNAYLYVQQWIEDENSPDSAKSTWLMFSKEKFTKRNVATKIINILTNQPGTEEPEGNAQFVWYEIDTGKDAIQEFLSENKGKIKLTDTEKIRGLFMQREGNDYVNSLIQHGIAKDWELIENTLHRNDFWSFISNDLKKEDGRINIIFQYIYDNDFEADKKYSGGDYLFRYYYQKLNNRSHDNTTIIEYWKKVMETFQMLLNWYHNPRIYNLIGLLIKERGGANQQITIKTIADIYNEDDVKTTEDFVKKLKQKVCNVIVENIPIVEDGNQLLDIEGEFIDLFYNKPSDKKKIPGLLRFINVMVLCDQIEKLLDDVNKPNDKKKVSDMGRSNRDEQCSIYRFPFEALDAFEWDVEHIDSATTNALKNEQEKKEWIEEAEITLKSILTENQYYLEQKKALEKDAGNNRETILKNMIELIRDIIGEDDSEERKNWIGNLTLLDCGTNRMYKNAIFARKQAFIYERVNKGVYVPICTQNIFNKTYNDCTKDDLKWDINDKKAYHDFILSMIKSFKEKYQSINI